MKYARPVAIGVVLCLMASGNLWLGWSNLQLRAQVSALKSVVMAAPMAKAKRPEKHKIAAAPRPETPRRRKVRPEPPGAASATAAVPRADLRDTVISKTVERVAAIGTERGWSQPMIDEAIAIMEDSFASGDSVRTAINEGDLSTAQARGEFAQIKEDTSYALEDALGTDEHQALQDALWTRK